MPDGKDFDRILLGAVVDPVAVVPAENLPQFGAVEFWERNPPELRIVRKHQCNITGIAIELDRIIEIEVFGDVIEGRLKSLEPALCPDDFHTATFCGFAVCLAMCFAIMRSTSAAVYTSPRSASPSATRMSSKVSSLSSFSCISSHVDALTNTPAERPFWVTITGRPVSRVCVIYPARLDLNSLRGKMSSFALKLYMAQSFPFRSANIVQNLVCGVKAA